jgi:diguanylate cyclase (GGDEF)-like protein
MTGVYNHGYFLKRLAEQAEETSATKAPLSLIMLDIDYFKQFNGEHSKVVRKRWVNQPV